MTEKDPIAALTNKALPAAQRLDAARAVGDALEKERPLAAAWRAVNTVMQDAGDVAEVRVAALRALARGARAAAPNQLVRSFAGDDARVLRKEAVAQLRAMTPDPVMEPMLRDRLAQVNGPQRLTALANLALGFGYDARIVQAYLAALQDSDENIRGVAVGGLAMVGEMEPVMAALKDPSAVVREKAVTNLGFYSTLRDVEIRALGQGLQDADEKVQKAARTALKRLGIQPMAAPPAKKRLQKKETGKFAWRELLEEWSTRALQEKEYAVTLEDDVVSGGWLGFPGAKSRELQALAKMLGKPLPPSYEAFLKMTNGFRRISPSIDEVYPAQRVCWFRDANADWVATLKEHALPVTPEQHRVYGDAQDTAVFDVAQLEHCVQISAVGDGVMLLNPQVTTEDGEWEAWFLASWLPGARRFRSFWELIQAEARLTA